MKAIIQNTSQIKAPARKTQTSWWVPAGLILISIIPDHLRRAIRLQPIDQRRRDHTRQRTLLCLTLACGHSHY
jgi:hypothetical protein